MNCKNYRTRTKKYKKYGYCIKYKKEVSLFCKECENLEYKEQKTMMGILPKCTFKVRDGHKLPRNHVTFELRKTCKNYEKGEPIRKY